MKLEIYWMIKNVKECTLKLINLILKWEFKVMLT